MSDKRYEDLDSILGNGLSSDIHSSRILVVGAGGIGCELLKNMVMSGFHNIEIIDLDTIDLSNLNRQFLFRKQHIDSPKAQIARESALKFNPLCNIEAHHANIKESRFGFEYFSSFKLVLMALDNIEARRHVNRLCLAADIPLIESGTAGYLGQVQVIRKNQFECYECRPQPRTKSYAYCTIHNTPSKPIHCIVWAKIKFSDFFSDQPGSDQTEANEDENPEEDLINDPVMVEEEEELKKELVGSKSRWVFRKLFHRDILQRCRMAELSGKDIWKGNPPKPILPPAISKVTNENKENQNKTEWTDQSIPTLDDCINLFLNTCDKLFARVEAGQFVEWDKDDEDALNFVVSASNIRCHMFQIPIQSKFDIKAIAGNIIPAIATTNAIIAGLIVLEAFKVLAGNINQCKYTYLLRRPSGKRVLMDVALEQPNKDCYICSSRQIQVKIDTMACDLEFFVTKVCKGELGMVFPCLFKGTDNLYECSDDMDDDDKEYMKEQGKKTLETAGITAGVIIRADDEFQDLSIDITILHRESTVSGEEKETENGNEDEVPLFEVVKGSPSTAGIPSEEGKDAPVTGKRARPEIDDNTEEPPTKASKM